MAQPIRRPIVAARTNHGEQNMREQEYQQLKQHLDALHKDNAALRQERDDLKLRNHDAKARVEAILERLKALEAQS